ncbi:MAG: DUF2235 domain-containing protein [Calditrichaceae bacterium]|nr:DUF2235 domain-containing protein [Calditrichaceae bacterium]MBN2707575.1 DUF2235 domain-containing protein [Calditrichaceae bacterium]RQV95659.1 MAG: DUF2235 domain-containing protein [Calditrichota bacterium]
MKKIIICCDGTWNTPDKSESGIPLATNVVKIAESIKEKDSKGIVQKVYYDAGVGTSGNWLKRIYDGATGSGLLRNILEAYEYLIYNYEAGDELFMLGFSRGAFTVRSLAGLIRNCGILRYPSQEIIKKAYKLYKSRKVSTAPAGREATLFRRTYAVQDITIIKFIGVWDTVGALGNPLLLNGIVSPGNRFHDINLSSTVANAYHAIAVDEKRANFRPALWNQQAHAKNQNVEQRWFIGVHSNVGGGYPSTALSDIALNWMVEKAASCGLELTGISANPDYKHHPIEESWKLFYRLRCPYHRPIGMKSASGLKTNETLDPTVIMRYKEDLKYRPKELCKYLTKNPDLLK